MHLVFLSLQNSVKFLHCSRSTTRFLPAPSLPTSRVPRPATEAERARETAPRSQSSRKEELLTGFKVPRTSNSHTDAEQRLSERYASQGDPAASNPSGHGLLAFHGSSSQSFLNSLLISDKPPQVRLHVVENAQLIWAVSAFPFFSDLPKESHI